MGTNQTTKETRRASYDAVIPKVKERSRLILETLGSRSMTVSEITDELVSADGGRWEAVAVDNVKSYLMDALADIPNREQITIIA